MTSPLEDAVAAICAGRTAIVPTDTVYGLLARPDEDAVASLYRLKGRAATQATALIASDLGALLDCLPELHGLAAAIAAAVLPGPYTLVLPNPAKRFPWLTGASPDAIGVRIPALTGDAQALLEQVGAVAGTSANLAGGSDPCRLADVPEALLAASAVLDGGELPGLASTVIDFTGTEPVVLRHGAGDAAAAIARAGEVRSP